MSFVEGSGADLLTNVSNTPLCSENEADKSNLQENLRFDSDDSVLDSDYEDSTSTNNGNSSNLDDDELLNEAPTTSQRAYSRKQSCTRRNLGKAYVNVKDVVVSERKLRPLIIDCRMKCKSKVPLAFQKSIFNKYWSLGTYNQRILFIGSLIEITDKKLNICKNTLKGHVSENFRLLIMLSLKAKECRYAKNASFSVLMRVPVSSKLF